MAPAAMIADAPFVDGLAGNVCDAGHNLLVARQRKFKVGDKIRVTCTTARSRMPVRAVIHDSDGLKLQVDVPASGRS